MARSSIADLVNQQARRWEAGREKAPRKPKPCIAISRLPYSGATELGQQLAQRLDYGVFGRELVDEIAEQEGIRRDLVAGLDEHVESSVERHVLDGFRRRGFTESDYLRAAVRVIATMGARGMTVIIGRGATLVLTPDQGLRVLVVAPLEWRRERFARIHKVDAKTAAERLEREDEGRQSFWRHHFKVDYRDPALYDLTVNTGTLSIDGAADLIAGALRQRFPS